MQEAFSKLRHWYEQWDGLADPIHSSGREYLHFYFSIWIPFVVIWTYLNVTKIISDLITARRVMSFDLEQFHVWQSHLKASHVNELLSIFALVPVRNLTTGAERSSNIFPSIWIISRTQLSICVVPSSTFSATVWTTWNKFQICRSLICTISGIIPFDLLRLVCHLSVFQWLKRLNEKFALGFQTILITQIGPAIVSTGRAVGCRIILVRPIPNRTVYFSSVGKATFVILKSNCTSLPTEQICLFSLLWLQFPINFDGLHDLTLCFWRLWALFSFGDAYCYFPNLSSSIISLRCVLIGPVS